MSALAIPTTVDDVLVAIATDAEIYTASGWRLAAHLASIVRLNDGPGRPDIARSGNYRSATEVAAFGLRGLSSHTTVARHVKNWLAYSTGVYPEPGDVVELPGDDVKYPPREENLGSRMPKTLELAIDKIVATHGLDAVLDLLDQFEATELESEAEPIGPTSKPALSLDERWAKWLTRMNTLMVKGARLADESEAPGVVLGVYADAGKTLYETLVERRIDAELREMLKGGV